MTTHAIIYDLQYPQGARLECAAAPDAPCRAIWDCDCETIHDFHVVDGVPHHYSTYDGGWEVRGHHVGRFDPAECNLRDWHENSEEHVLGVVRVAVESSWEGDYYTFEATSAELIKEGQ